MANYTLTIEEIMNHPLYKDKGIFPDYYPFYEDTVEGRRRFEEKFILRYQFHEIGFETVYRFQKHLEAVLAIKMPYYRQLYETELKTKNIDFMLNKDLKETFIRSIDETNKGQQQEQSNQTGTASQHDTNTLSDNSNVSSNSNSSNDHKESFIRDGVSSVNLEQGYLTGVSNDLTDGETSQTSTSNSTGETNTTTESSLNSQNKTLTDGSHQLAEKTELISQGNIGVTSSAELLEKWRNVLINIDEMILDELQDLFMKVY